MGYLFPGMGLDSEEHIQYKFDPETLENPGQGHHQINQKSKFKEKKGFDFPDEPKEQLWHSINAVFGSWMNDRAIAYRQIHDITGLVRKK